MLFNTLQPFIDQQSMHFQLLLSTQEFLGRAAASTKRSSSCWPSTNFLPFLAPNPTNAQWYKLITGLGNFLTFFSDSYRGSKRQGAVSRSKMVKDGLRKCSQKRVKKRSKIFKKLPKIDKIYCSFPFQNCDLCAIGCFNPVNLELIQVKFVD